MSEHPFLILCGGDTAEADDWDGIATAVRTLMRDQYVYNGYVKSDATVVFQGMDEEFASYVA